MSFYIFGDLHGSENGEGLSLNNKNFPEQKQLSKKDFLFQLGDFGYYFYYPKARELYKKDFNAIKQLASKKYTLFIIPGNHENYDLINSLPLVEKWNGLVYEHKIENNSIYIAKRGEVYIIDGKKIFTFSGALSGDVEDRNTLEEHLSGQKKKKKKYRYNQFVGFKYEKVKISQVNYWHEEIPTEEEYLNAIKNLEKYNFNVDYVFTHTSPKNIIDKLFDINQDRFLKKYNDPVAFFLEKIYHKINFKLWCFGHFHKNINFIDTKGRFICHYMKPPLKIL